MTVKITHRLPSFRGAAVRGKCRILQSKSISGLDSSALLSISGVQLHEWCLVLMKLLNCLAFEARVELIK